MVRPGWICFLSLVSLYQANISKIEMIHWRAARWVKNNYSPYKSVTRMLDDLSRQSFENRPTDACHIMFHRFIYDHVAIQVPLYFERPKVATRHTHHLAFRWIHTYTTYDQQSFYPATIVLWNKLDSEAAIISDPNSFKDRVRAISNQSPEVQTTVLTCF